MAGVGQAGAHHPLIAGNHLLAAVGGFDIGGQQEMVRQAAGFGVAQHEAFLVGANGRTHHFGGDDQKIGIE